MLSIQILLISYAAFTFPNKQGFLLRSAGVLRYLVILIFGEVGIYLLVGLFSLCPTLYFLCILAGACSTFSG